MSLVFLGGCNETDISFKLKYATPLPGLSAEISAQKTINQSELNSFMKETISKIIGNEITEGNAFLMVANLNNKKYDPIKDVYFEIEYSSKYIKELRPNNLEEYTLSDINTKTNSLGENITVATYKYGSVMHSTTDSDISFVGVANNIGSLNKETSRSVTETVLISLKKEGVVEPLAKDDIQLKICSAQGCT